MMKDFEILNNALGEVKGGLTDLYDSSIAEAPDKKKTCSSFCTVNCSGSVGSEVGTTRGVYTDDDEDPRNI